MTGGMYGRRLREVAPVIVRTTRQGSVLTPTRLRGSRGHPLGRSAVTPRAGPGVALRWPGAGPVPLLRTALLRGEGSAPEADGSTHDLSQPRSRRERPRP